jgi:hypothetical protein
LRPSADQGRAVSARKTIEEFDFAFQSSLPKNIILHLGQLDFLAGKETRRGSLFARRYGVSFQALG